MKGMSCRRGGRGANDQFQCAYDGTSSTLRVARNDLIGWLTERGFDHDLRDRAALVLSELATNAIQASPGIKYGVRISEIGDGSAVVAVSSHTDLERPPPREHWGPATSLAARGRGLMIVDELADDVRVELRNRHTIVVTVTLRSPIRDSPA